MLENALENCPYQLVVIQSVGTIRGRNQTGHHLLLEDPLDKTSGFTGGRVDNIPRALGGPVGQYVTCYWWTSWIVSHVLWVGRLNSMSRANGGPVGQYVTSYWWTSWTVCHVLWVGRLDSMSRANGGLVLQYVACYWWAGWTVCLVLMVG